MIMIYTYQDKHTQFNPGVEHSTLHQSNSIYFILKWEYDIQEYYSDQCVPFIDMKRHLKTDDRRNTIGHGFYQKPVSNILTLSSKSSMHLNTKSAILISEGLRRLRSNVIQSTIQEHIYTIKDFNRSMMRSAHSEILRCPCLITASPYRAR